MIRDSLRIAIGNLLHRRTRSWLTLIGIFIGITAVVALISLGQGLQSALTSEFLQLGADKILVTAKSAGGTSANQQTANQLRDEDLRAIERTQGVDRAVGFWQRAARISWGRDDVGFYQVNGITDKPRDRKIVEDFMTLKMGQGRDVQEGDDSKAVIGYELTNPATLEHPMKVGDRIKVNNKTFEVVGAYEKMGDPQADSAVYVSENGFKGLFDVGDTHDAIVAQVSKGQDPEFVAQQLRQALRSERGLDPGDEDFDIQTPQDLINSFNAIFNIVQFVIIGIAAISLIVGGIGIMNTMYTSVLERTREIGIMKAIGARNGDILSIFLIESGLLGLLGGGIGVATGLGLAKITEYIGKTVLDTTLLQAWWSWWLVGGSLAFAFTVGVLSGILPARKASRQPAVESLRYE